MRIRRLPIYFESSIGFVCSFLLLIWINPLSAVQTSTRPQTQANIVYDSGFVSEQDRVLNQITGCDQRLHIQHDWSGGFEHLHSSCGCSSPITLVTAYFALEKSKHSLSEFDMWNARFFALPDNMIIYTDEMSLARIAGTRSRSSGCTIVILTEIWQTLLAMNIDWREQHEKDLEKEIHAPELYIIWNQKSPWLAAAAEKNPFASRYFFWTDSGQFRDPIFIEEHVTHGERWIQNVDYLPHCTITFLSIKAFEKDELQLNDLNRSKFINSNEVRLGGGNFGGDKCAVELWNRNFLKKINEYVDEGHFAGKDQPVYASTCIENITACFFVAANNVSDINDLWFAMQPVLHGLARPVPRYEPVVGNS